MKKKIRMVIAKLFAFHANAKKTRMAIAKLFVIHANAKRSEATKHPFLY